MSPTMALDLDTTDWPLILSEAGPEGRTVAIITSSDQDTILGGDSAVDAATALRYARLFQAAPELREALAELVGKLGDAGEDALCHKGIMPAAQCAYCGPILKARELLARLEDA
jgi:hypothetical protein